MCKGPHSCLSAVGKEASIWYFPGVVEDNSSPSLKARSRTQRRGHIFCPVGAFWKLAESLNSCPPALPWILDQVVSPIGFCPHRGQPVTLSPAFFLVHSQPHWKEGSVQKPQMSESRLLCPPDPFAHWPRHDHVTPVL